MTDISRLVLTRKPYQSINIGGMVTVTVEEIRGRTVRIAVQAPRGIAVHRQEIYERILGAGPDNDGTAGVCVPAGPVTGPDRPPTGSWAPGPRLRRAAVALAREAAAATLEDGPSAGALEEGGAAPGLHPGGGWGEPL